MYDYFAAAAEDVVEYIKNEVNLADYTNEGNNIDWDAL